MVEAMLVDGPCWLRTLLATRKIIEDGVTGFLADAAPTVPFLVRSLERLWAHRNALELTGKPVAERIGSLVPENRSKYSPRRSNYWPKRGADNKPTHGACLSVSL